MNGFLRNTISLASALTFAALPSLAVSFTYQTVSDPGYSQTRIFGISDNGILSGDHAGGNVFTDANGTFTEYSLNDGQGTTAFDARVNNSGQIVGTAGGFNAFSIVNGVATDVGPPGSTESFGSGVNNAGMIIGNYYTGSGFAGFTLLDGVYTSIRMPGATSSEILGVNDPGEVVGQYDGDTGFTYLNGIYTSFTGPGSNTILWGVDSHGNLAGDIQGAFCGSQPECGFYYDGSGFSLVAVPGAQFTTVQGMNNLDQIVGTYIDANGNFQGFVATPDTFAAGTPEPGTFVLMAGSLGAALLAMRHRAKQKNNGAGN